MAFHRRTTAWRRGFTLAEVLVTLAIIAVMAAVLLPALNSQLAKGDTGRLASDLTNIQTAAQAFVSDVHRYPANISQLTTALSLTSSPNDLTSTPIPLTLTAKWKGPYLTKDVVGNTAGGAISSSFGYTQNSSNSLYYLTVSVTGVSASDFANIENILDEGTPTAQSTTAGSVRWVSTGSSTLTFLALPVQ
jgi:prepilin-type N-terminal cleavage/methylation domain-containing protein